MSLETFKNSDFFVRHGPRMAHRICDELAVLQTATDLLINDETISSATRGKIEALKDRIGYVARFAWQFLGLTNTQEGQWTTVDVRETILGLVPVVHRLLGDRQDLEIALQGNVWPIRADIQRFEEVIIDLVVNARDAMPDRASFRVRAANITKAECITSPRLKSFAADYVVVDVADTGPAIPSDLTDRVFEPFCSARGKAYPFRLASAHHTIQRFNGHIVVDSAPQATVFRVLLPRYVRPW
jgi:two-component system, cell cycle sensor histidine kinase and response regulator CckA